MFLFTFSALFLVFFDEKTPPKASCKSRFSISCGRREEHGSHPEKTVEDDFEGFKLGVKPPQHHYKLLKATLTPSSVYQPTKPLSLPHPTYPPPKHHAFFPKKNSPGPKQVLSSCKILTKLRKEERKSKEASGDSYF